MPAAIKHIVLLIYVVVALTDISRAFSGTQTPIKCFTRSFFHRYKRRMEHLMQVYSRKLHRAFIFPPLDLAEAVNISIADHLISEKLELPELRLRQTSVGQLSALTRIAINSIHPILQLHLLA